MQEKIQEQGNKARQVTLISPKAGFVGLTALKVGRNDLCRCGSGKKAKHCCGTETKYMNREQTKIKKKEDENI